MEGQYQNVRIDVFLADPMIEWWVEASDPTRCKHTYHIDLPFRDASDEDMLEAIFYFLNMRHPDDYKHRSLSVGDVVTLNNDRSYLCAPLGWQRITPPLRKGVADCRSPKTVAIEPKENVIDANN